MVFGADRGAGRAGVVVRVMGVKRDVIIQRDVLKALLLRLEELRLRAEAAENEVEKLKGRS